MLSQEERTRVENALTQVRASSPNLEERIYAPVYDEIRAIFREKEDFDVDPYSTVWLYGAARVNSNEGIAASFIREYTRRQIELRGGNVSLQDLQAASNRISENIIQGVLESGTLPDIHKIAEEDAAGAVEEILSKNPDLDLAIWSGNLLFLLLNHDDSFYNNVLREEGDTYDVLSVFEIASDIVLSLTNNILTTIPASIAIREVIDDFFIADFSPT